MQIQLEIDLIMHTWTHRQTLVFIRVLLQQINKILGSTLIIVHPTHFFRLLNHFYTIGRASDFNFSIGNKELQWEQCKKKLSQKLVEKCKGLDISEVRKLYVCITLQIQFESHTSEYFTKKHNLCLGPSQQHQCFSFTIDWQHAILQ